MRKRGQNKIEKVVKQWERMKKEDKCTISCNIRKNKETTVEAEI
jgi:hypothetical protein